MKSAVLISLRASQSPVSIGFTPPPSLLAHHDKQQLLRLAHSAPPRSRLHPVAPPALPPPPPPERHRYYYPVLDRAHSLGISAASPVGFLHLARSTESLGWR